MTSTKSKIVLGSEPGHYTESNRTPQQQKVQRDLFYNSHSKWRKYVKAKAHICVKRSRDRVIPRMQNVNTKVRMINVAGPSFQRVHREIISLDKQCANACTQKHHTKQKTSTYKHELHETLQYYIYMCMYLSLYIVW